MAPKQEESHASEGSSSSGVNIIEAEKQTKERTTTTKKKKKKKIIVKKVKKKSTIGEGNNSGHTPSDANNNNKKTVKACQQVPASPGRALCYFPSGSSLSGAERLKPKVTRSESFRLTRSSSSSSLLNDLKDDDNDGNNSDDSAGSFIDEVIAILPYHSPAHSKPTIAGTLPIVPQLIDLDGGSNCASLSSDDDMSARMTSSISSSSARSSLNDNGSSCESPAGGNLARSSSSLGSNKHGARGAGRYLSSTGTCSSHSAQESSRVQRRNSFSLPRSNSSSSLLNNLKGANNNKSTQLEDGSSDSSECSLFTDEVIRTLPYHSPKKSTTAIATRTEQSPPSELVLAGNQSSSSSTDEHDLTFHSSLSSSSSSDDDDDDDYGRLSNPSKVGEMKFSSYREPQTPSFGSTAPPTSPTRKGPKTKRENQKNNKALGQKKQRPAKSNTTTSKTQIQAAREGGEDSASAVETSHSKNSRAKAKRVKSATEAGGDSLAFDGAGNKNGAGIRRRRRSASGAGDSVRELTPVVGRSSSKTQSTTDVTAAGAKTGHGGREKRSDGTACCTKTRPSSKGRSAAAVASGGEKAGRGRRSLSVANQKENDNNHNSSSSLILSPVAASAKTSIGDNSSSSMSVTVPRKASVVRSHSQRVKETTAKEKKEQMLGAVVAAAQAMQGNLETDVRKTGPTAAAKKSRWSHPFQRNPLSRSNKKLQHNYQQQHQHEIAEL